VRPWLLFVFGMLCSKEILCIEWFRAQKSFQGGNLMRKYTHVALLLAAVLVPTAATAEVLKWKAIAISVDKDTGEYWYPTRPLRGETEEEARAKAVNLCESKSGRTCSMTTSVPAVTTDEEIEWIMVISDCGNMKIATGGSYHDKKAANTRAGKKFRRVDGEGCRIVKVFPAG
jgi:hypothetical protein